MSVLLDESVPARRAKALSELGCAAAPFPNNWKGSKNGELLRRLREQRITCLITCDRNLRYQQSIATSEICLVVLSRQRYSDLAPLTPAIARAVSMAQAGNVLFVNMDSTISNG